MWVWFLTPGISSQSLYSYLRVAESPPNLLLSCISFSIVTPGWSLNLFQRANLMVTTPSQAIFQMSSLIWMAASLGSLLVELFHFHPWFGRLQCLLLYSEDSRHLVLYARPLISFWCLQLDGRTLPHFYNYPVPPWRLLGAKFPGRNLKHLGWKCLV